MNLLKYAKIGKAPFIRAIGIQEENKNVVYTEHEELDRIASGCFWCENYNNIDFFEYLPVEAQWQACMDCQNCADAVYKTVKKEKYEYKDEKSIFGYKPRLKAISLKLLLLYHFASPDKNGLVRGLSTKELADELGCSERSIKNANQYLQKYGYIFYSKDPANKKQFQVFLTEYKDYFLSENEGGRGYVTLNQEGLMEFLQLKDVNQLRILLRATIEMDTSSNVIDNEVILTATYSSIRRFLPRYCKPGVIKRALSSVTSMFQVVFQEDVVHFRINNAFHGTRLYEESHKQNEQDLKLYLLPIAETIASLNSTLIQRGYADEDDVDFIEEKGFANLRKSISGRMLYTPIDLVEEEYEDLAGLCTIYSFDKVKEALRYIYKHYVSQTQFIDICETVRMLLRTDKYQEVASLFNPA